VKVGLAGGMLSTGEPVPIAPNVDEFILFDQSKAAT
jgi:hypothetical protein